MAARSTRTQRQAAAAMASMTARAGSKRVRYRAAPVMWEFRCVRDCPLSRATTFARTSGQKVMAAEGPLAHSPLANDLGEFQVRLLDALVGLPPVDGDVGELDVLRRQLRDLAAGVRARIGIEVPAVEVPHHLVLALG